MPVTRMNIDTSELEGKSFSCIDGCAMCCLCQPELAESELGTFMEDEHLARGLTREHVIGTMTEAPTAIRLQGGSGACHFLRDKRCTIFDIRPQMCRQFPIHIHALDRIQMNVNLSCRGVVGDGGDSLSRYAEKIISGISGQAFKNELAAARGGMRVFEDRCRRTRNHQSPDRLVSAARRLVPLLARADGIGKLLAFTNREPRIGNMPKDELVALVEGTCAPDDLDTVAREANYEQFDLENPAWLPVYIDEGLRWNTFRSNGGAIDWMELSETGAVKLLKRLDPQEIRLLPREPTGLEVFAGYADALIGRDHFMGYVYHVCAEQKYSHDLMTVYIGVLGTTLLDLWWRASLVGKLYGKKAIGRSLATEGIRAFDMDCLNAPTLGAVF